MSRQAKLVDPIDSSEPIDDWEFANITYKQTQYYTHGFHPYTAKFIPQIPKKLMRLYSLSTKDVILDPFVGSGTTVVEAKLMGRSSVGVDINPLAIMIAKAKISPIDHGKLRAFTRVLDARKRRMELEHLTDGVFFEEDRKWFTPSVLSQLEIIRREVDKMEEGTTRNFILVGLSALLKGISNARLDRIVPTLPESNEYIDKKHYHTKVNNLERHINVYSRLSSRLKRTSERLLDYLDLANGSPAELFVGDARELETLGSNLLVEGKVALVITSPPYWSAIDYEEINRLSLQFLGLNRDGLRKQINGKNYLNEMAKVYEQISRLLRPHGKFCLVIGESKNGIEERLADLVETYDMALFRAKPFSRRIHNHTFFAKEIKTERIYVFEKK